MTVLLVMCLFLAFIGTDHLVRLASRHEAARRAAAKRGNPPRPIAPPHAVLAKRSIG